MIKLIQVIILSVIASGCAYTVQPRPDTFGIEPITEFTSPVAISIINTQTNTIDRVHLTNMGATFSGNMKSWADTAVEITKRELTARGAKVLDGEQRRLELSITSIEGEARFSAFRYKTILKVKTGSGYEGTYIGDNASPATVYRAADGAVMRATSAMLRDPVIVKYITSSKVLTRYKPEGQENSPYDALEELKALFDKGILTKDEYNDKKREILQHIK